MLISSTQAGEMPQATPGSAADCPPPASLSAAAMQRFRDEGFLVLADLCDGTELHSLRSILLDLFAEHAGRAEGNQFDMLSLDQEDGDAIQPQILKPSLYAPALLRTAYFRRVQAVARQLLGASASFSFDHSILKPAGSCAATPWHQDEAYGADPYLHRDQISFWMPLQDVSEANGCMRYIPGSNRGALLPHRSLDDDPRIQAIECPTAYFDESAARPQPVPAGWCILHDGRTLHSALPNRSTQDRLAYVLAFCGPPVARPVPLHYTWLAIKRTASIERSKRWRSRGGFGILFARRLRQALLSDIRTLPFKLQRLLRLGRAYRRTAQRELP